MTHGDEYKQFLHDCGPLLDEMYRRLGSWEAVGKEIGRAVATDRAIDLQIVKIVIVKPGNA